MTVGIFVVVYSWVDPINTLCSSAHHDCQQEVHRAEALLEEEDAEIEGLVATHLKPPARH